MKDDEIAALGLPRVSRSPWRWFLYVIGAVLVLTGISGFVVGVEDIADLVISLVMVALGVAVAYLSRRSGVVVSERYVEERGVFALP